MGVVGEPKLGRDRKRPKSGSYYIYWTDDERGSCEKSLRTKDRTTAFGKFEEWKILNLGRTVVRRAEDVTLSEVLRYYAKIKCNDVSAPERIKDALKALMPYWGSKPVSAVNKLSCIRYREDRASIYAAKRPTRPPLSPNTIRRELAVLSAAIKVANDDGLINRQVTVHRPREMPVDIPYFSCAQALQLIRMAPRVKRARRYLQLFLLLGFLTGRRKEAILSLRWRDVDMRSGFIYWNPQDRISTKKERPPGAIPPRLYKYLRRQRARFPHDEFVISNRGAAIKDIKTAFAALMRLYLEVEQERAALDIGGRFTVTNRAYPHLLRHSCATWLMQKGVKPAAAAPFLGMSEDTLYRRYYHHHPEFQREAANAF